MKQTLQAVQKQFTHWRQNKKSQGARLPEELWESALSLIPEYTHTEIIKTLRLSYAEFRQRLHGQSSGQQPVPHMPHFVELPGSRKHPPLLSSSLACSQIEVERPDGYRLRLFSCLEQPLQGQEVIREFLQGKHAADCRSS